MKTEISKIIKDENLKGLVTDINEVFLDSFLESGIIKDIPILGLVSKVINIGNTIQERLYTKKLLTFLKQLEDTKPEDREKEINKIDENENYKTKVGEKLLYIINETDDCEKAEYIGILFKWFLEQELEYVDFIRCVDCINKTNIIDLNFFIKESFIESYINSNIENYLNTGLINQEYKNPLNEINKNRLITHEKAQIKYSISRSGIYIRKYLK
ncbi:hypothetical protein H5J24_01555 [Chryseobacterium capnotolerans]|uniref:hypothetical protein n=1 Tax=Chryseobacterium TaxID=59732 RepID=UPI00083A2891|nr:MULTISPECIES: hypothetical protein [Chryseobacterium]UHO38898.1 hypothetical protein H5J24_01555 [Chryseobacterium capnotolerans]